MSDRQSTIVAIAAVILTLLSTAGLAVGLSADDQPTDAPSISQDVAH